MRVATTRGVSFIIIGALSLQGCAYGTLIHGSKQELLFNSSPTGAHVAINGQDVGKTPLKWALPRKAGALVEFIKEGCEKKQIMLNSSVSPIVFANLLPFLFYGLLVGGIIDMMSGGAYKLDPDPVYVSLDCPEPKTGSTPNTEGAH